MTRNEFKRYTFGFLLATLTTNEAAFAYKGGYTQQDVTYARDLQSQGVSTADIIKNGILNNNWRAYTAIIVLYEGLEISARETFMAANLHYARISKF